MKTLTTKSSGWFQRLVSSFYWRFHHRCGANVYLENKLTGERKVEPDPMGYSPIDHEWLKGANDKLSRCELTERGKQKE
jgi:hypothetical protein